MGTEIETEKNTDAIEDNNHLEYVFVSILSLVAVIIIIMLSVFGKSKKHEKGVKTETTQDKMIDDAIDKVKTAQTMQTTVKFQIDEHSVKSQPEYQSTKKSEDEKPLIRHQSVMSQTSNMTYV